MAAGDGTAGVTTASITKARDSDGVARFTVTVPGCLFLSGIENEEQAIEFAMLWAGRVRIKRAGKWTVVWSQWMGLRAA